MLNRTFNCETTCWSNTSKMRRRHDMENDVLNETRTPDENQATKTSIYSLPTYIPLIVIFLLGGTFLLVQYADNYLPTALTIEDETTHPDQFIGERAYNSLKVFTQIGTHPSGSYENEVLAVDYLKREFDFIKQTSNPNQKLEIDHQLVSGSHYLKTLPFGRILSYANLQNLAVKLHGASNHTLLVNAHFDSVPTSPGASDDGINVVAMLEVLRKVSRRPHRPQHNVVFLFNGAEEPGLQASYGFVAGHRWAAECTTVVNLEACGNGGKAVLFQTGPDAPWLMRHYVGVPYPYGNVAGEELFQTGLLPSDTDFRVFRDFGGMVGVDMAFYKEGYRYHTKHDNFNSIPKGSVQQIGANLLHLVEQLSNADELSNPKHNPGKTVYFDVLGLVMISYTSFQATCLNILAVIVSLALFGYCLQTIGHDWTICKYFIIITGAILAGWIGAFACVAIIASLIDSFQYSMSWYAQPWILFGLYVIPTVLVCALPLQFIRLAKISDGVQAQLQLHSVRLIWTTLLFCATCFSIRTAFLLFNVVLFGDLVYLLIYIFKLQFKAHAWLIVHLLLTLPLSILVFQVAISSLTLLIPMTGRIGQSFPVELVLAGTVAMFTILSTSSLVVVSNLVRDCKWIMYGLGCLFFVHFVLVFTPVGFPYRVDGDLVRPERFWMVHTLRSFENETGASRVDSGVFVLNMDRNSPFKVGISEFEVESSLADDCKLYLLCGMPLVHPKMIQIVEESRWIKTSAPPSIPNVLQFASNKSAIDSTSRRYDLEIYGSDRMSIYLSPKIGCQITRISLLDAMPSSDNVAKWNGRLLYFLFHISGKELGPLRLSLDVKAAEAFDENDKLVEIFYSAIFVHENTTRNEEYSTFLGKFPHWTDVTAWIGITGSKWL